MKIALLLSGQPRFVKEAFSGLQKSILSEHNVDTFCYMWFDETKIGELQSDKFARHNSWGQRKNTRWSGKEIQEIRDCYNPISMTIKKEYDWSLLPAGYSEIDTSYVDEGKNRADDIEIYSVREIASELFAMNEVMKLLKEHQRKNNFVYDWVIRMRPDFYVNKKIDLASLQNNHMHIPNIGRLPQRFGMHGLTNAFAMSSFENMDIYMSGYEEFFNRVINYGACVAGAEAWTLSWLYANGFEDPAVWNPLLSSPNKREEWQRRLPQKWESKRRPIIINRKTLVGDYSGVGLKTGIGDCWIIRTNEPYDYGV